MILAATNSAFVGSSRSQPLSATAPMPMSTPAEVHTSVIRWRASTFSVIGSSDLVGTSKTIGSFGTHEYPPRMSASRNPSTRNAPFVCQEAAAVPLARSIAHSVRVGQLVEPLLVVGWQRCLHRLEAIVELLGLARADDRRRDCRVGEGPRHG